MHYSIKGRGRFFSLFLSIIFLFTNNSYAVPSTQTRGTPILSGSWRPAISLPSEVGSIQESYNGSSDKFVIYLQDAHSHPEAQWNNYRILENISRQFPVDTIFVEGTTGLVDTTPYLNLPDYEITLKTAENLLNKGYITGEEYFSLASRQPRVITGIESPDLYRENINGLKAILRYKEENIAKIEGLRLSLDSNRFNKELREFYNLYKGYSCGDINLSEYAAHLTSERENLKKFLSLLALEKTIDFDVVNSERDELIDKLIHKLSTEEARELVSRSLEFRLNRITAMEYYQYIAGLADVIPINLSNYLSYLRQYHELDRVALLREIEEESEDILEKLCQNSEESVLLRKLKNLDLIEKLLDTSLTPSEWAYYKKNKEDFGLEPLPSGFYKTAEERDTVLAENLIRHLDFTGTEQAVLITGGFHTEGITRRLRQRGISYIVMAPVITDRNNKNQETYIRLLSKSTLKAQEQTQRPDFFNLFSIGAALDKLGGEINSDTAADAFSVVSGRFFEYVRDVGDNSPRLQDAKVFFVNLAEEYERTEEIGKILIAIIAYNLSANLARDLGLDEERQRLADKARELLERVPPGIIRFSAAEAEKAEIGIQEEKKNDWLTISEGGQVQTRYYLSKPVLVDGINGKWKKRYLGSRAKAELDVILAKLRATGVRELSTDKHVQYALLSPEIESGQTENPFTMAIVEEHPSGERVLWTKPTHGLTEEARYGQLLEFLVPLNAKPRIRGLESWREQEFTTTRTTFDYEKGEWGETQADVTFSSCDGCLQCVVNCPDASLMVDQDADFVGVDQDHCSGCRYCEDVCPIAQIKLKDRKSLTATFVSKIEGDNGERTELAGGLVMELAEILLQNGLLEGNEVRLGDFKAIKAYSDTDILQVELLHKDAEEGTRPLVITFLKQDGEWQRAWLRQKRTVLSYGMGELELRMVRELQREGYSVLAGINRIRFTEISGIPRNEWERANNKVDEFVGMGLYSDRSLWEWLDTGVDIVITGESSWLRAVDKRTIMQKTGLGLWVISPHNILETHDKVLDSVMERIYEDIQKNSPEEWYKWIGRAGYSTNLFVRIMQGIRGLGSKLFKGLIQGHRLCPACPQPKVVENVCQMAARIAGEEGKVARRLIIANTGCLTASGMSNIHGTAFRDPAGRILFGNAVAVASGVEAGLKYLRKMEKLHPDEKFEVIVFTGDGGDADIGLQPLLGAVERGHRIRYFVFNNEAYMNTGGQRSGATSVGARTKSTVPGPIAPGKMQTRKVVADYVAQHLEPLVIETNPDEEPHFQRTLELAFKHDGFVYCNISSTCHTGQGFLGEQARSVSRTRIHTGMSPLVIRNEARTSLEIPSQLKNQELDSSLLNWLSKQGFIRDYTDRDNGGIFIGDGTSLTDRTSDRKARLTINPKYKAIELLKYFQPVIESMRLEGRFSHLVDPKTGDIKKGVEPIVYINQLDVIIRLLILFKDSGEYGDLYTRKEYRNIIRAMVELRSQQRKLWFEKEEELKKNAREAKEDVKTIIRMDEGMRQRNNARLGNNVLNVEWFGFAGWGVQSAGHMTSDILRLLGFYPIDWPSFGPERAGAPVEAYNKASGEPLSDRSSIKTSQIAFVFDETHMTRKKYKDRIFKTLAKDGIIFINTPLGPKAARARFGIEGRTIITADLSKIAREKLSDRRRVSIAVLGALIRALELKGIEIDVNKIRELISAGAKKAAGANLECFNAVYTSSQIEITPPREGAVKKYEDKEGGQASPMDRDVATGNEVVAKAVLQSKYGVYAGYPITPSTTVGEYLSELKAKGVIDTEVVLTESEYAAMSALVGSAAAGTLSFTATDSQGLLLMHEVLPVAAGLGLPIVMYVANRAITRKDLSIYCDHNDSMLQLATGWVQLYAKNNQELYDLMIMAPVLWKYLRAPIMVNGDGFNLSHTRELVTYLTDEQVREFQREIDEELGKIWEGTMAPGSSPASYMEGAVAQDRRLSWDIAGPKIMEVLKRRGYRPVHTYGDKGADIAIVAEGSVVATIEKAIEMARELGINIKVLDIKTMVPFAYDMVAEEIARCDTVVVLDRSTAPGLYPPLLKEVMAANTGRARIYGEIYGLGGRNPQPEDILEIIRKAVLVKEAIYRPSESDLKKVMDLLWELAYLHIADMKLDQNPFSTYAEEQAELNRYLQEELINPLLAGDYVRFLRIVGHSGVREGIEDERNKRLRVLELLAEMFRTAGLPAGGLTNIHPTQKLETKPILEAVKEEKRGDFKKGYTKAARAYLARKEQIYIPRLLGVLPGSTEYEELKRQSSLKPEEFEQVYIRQSALFLDEGMFSLDNILSGKEKGETCTEGWAATAKVTEEQVRTKGPLGSVVVTKRPRVWPIIEQLLAETASDKDDYETIVTAVYHELVETYLQLFIKRLGLGKVYTKDNIHELTRQLEMRNFGASRVSPYVSRAQIKALEVYGLPNDPYLRKIYLQNELIKRLERGEDTFNDDEKVLLDELAGNGYSGVIKVDGRYRLAGLRKVKGEEFDSVLLESRKEGYVLTGETRIDPVTGLKKVYIGNEVIPALIEIMEELGDADSINRIKAGGRAALLEMEGYPLYLGIIWEGKNGDTILWSKEPPKVSGLSDTFYGNYIGLLNASARRSPLKRFGEWGYELYEPATMLDLEGQSSLGRKTSDWAEQMPVINWAKCVNCLHCAFKCPDIAMLVQDKTLIGVDPDHCKGCGICEAECKKQGHEAIMMVNKDELFGTQRGAWLDKKTSWQTSINGGLANNLYEFLTSQLGDSEQILFGDYVITRAYKGTLPISGDEVLQLRLLPKTAPKNTKPLVYTFIKSPGSADWHLIVKPQRNILVIGTGETEARIAIESIRKGFEVRVVRRFSPDNQPVYYDVEELEEYTYAFRDAGLWASDDVIKLVNAQAMQYQAHENVRFISRQIPMLRERLGTQIPDFLVTGQLDLISEKILRASIPITGQPVIVPGETYISRDNDLDSIMDDIFRSIPPEIAERYARHARIKIPKGQLDHVVDHICHFAGGHGLCTGCDAGIIANKIIAAAVASGEKIGKKMRVAFVGATGCLEVATTIDMISYGPKTGEKSRLQISYFHSAFTNVGASISGVIHAWEARKAAGEIPEGEELIVVGVGGDGGTHDIGLQALSGAWERGEHVFYIEYNNGAYMNTGIQRSSGTPEGAATTTSPYGKEQEEKDVPELLASHQRDSKHLVMTSSTHDLADFMEKLEEGMLFALTTGPAYLGICATCVPGHRLSTPAMANKTNQIAAETASFVSYTIRDGLLELTPYTPEVPEWDPAKKDYKFRYRYKDKDYVVYGDDYIKRREEFARMHRENGGKNMRWLTARPVVDRLWAEGRFRQKRNDLEFINRLQMKIVEKLQGYHQRDRITKKTDRILRKLLASWKLHPEYKNIFRTVEDPRDLEKDIYADIKPEYRELIGYIRRLLASSPSLESIYTEERLVHLLELIPHVMAGEMITEDGLVEVARAIVDTVEGALTGREKLEKLRAEKATTEGTEAKKGGTEERLEIVTEEQRRNNNLILKNELVTVAWKSRGGKGAVMANKAFAKLLLYLGGYESDFPFFGPERQGAPVEAFLIAGGGEIMELGTPLSKDFTIVLDEKAWEDIEADSTGEELPRFLHGQAEDGVLLVNTDLKPEEVRDRYKLYGRWNSLKIYTIDAGRITAKYGGDPTKPNMTLLGASLVAFQYFGIQYNKDVLFKKIAERDLVGVFGPGAVQAFIEAHENIVEEENSPKTHKDRVQLMAERIVEATAERFPEGIRLDGNEAAAKFYEQIAHFLPLVFATYPITPTTQVGEIVSGVAVYNRKLGRKLLEYIAAESEHSAMSACVAAALCGSVAGFATGSQGLAYAWEAVALADDLRAAGLVLYVGNREINAPLNILYGRSDSDTLRRGWLKFIAATQQEVYDFGFIALLASYLARRPAEIDYAAFFVTHTGSNVKLLSDEQVKQITDRINRIKKDYETLVDSRKAWGYVAHEGTFEERRYQESEAVHIASQRALLEAFKLFGEITGRDYPYFQTYRLEDAEQVVAIVGAHGKAVQKAVDELREEGINVGMFWPRVNGPFVGDVIGPEHIARQLGNARLVQAVEHFADDGEVWSPLATQIATALYSQGKLVRLMNWIMALGGRTLDVNKIKELIKLGIILGGSPQLPVTSNQIEEILGLPEIRMVVTRLVSIYGDKLKRNYPSYNEDDLVREKENYKERIIRQLKNRDYINFLERKEYADVRREQKELEFKIRLIKLIELTLARRNLDSAEGEAQKYLAQALYHLSADFKDQDRARHIIGHKVSGTALLCRDYPNLDLELTPYEGRPGIFIGREKGEHQIGYAAASITLADGTKAVALNPTFIEYLRSVINGDKIIEAAIFHEQNEEALGHDEVLKQEKEKFGVSPVDPAYSLAQHYAILNEVETYGLPEFTRETEFIHQYYRRYLLVTGLFKAGINPGFIFEDYRRIIHAFYIDKGMTPPSDSVLLNDLDLFLRDVRLIKVGNIYFQNGRIWDAVVAGIKAGMASVIKAIVDFAGTSELNVRVVDRGIEVTKQNGHVRDPARTETREFQSLYISHILKAAGLPEIKIRENITTGQWGDFINRLFLISRRQSVDPYLGQAFIEWREDRLRDITQPRTILFTLEALEDNIYDAPARALIEKLTSSNVTIAIATKDEKDAKARLGRINFPITDNIRFITYTDQPDVSRFGLSAESTVLAYNKDLKFINTTGFKAVEISHGVSLPQAFTFIIGLFSKSLADVVADLKIWLQSKGFSKDEIEEIVRAIPEQGIILPLPAVKRLTDDIQADKSDSILISA